MSSLYSAWLGIGVGPTLYIMSRRLNRVRVSIGRGLVLTATLEIDFSVIMSLARLCPARNRNRIAEHDNLQTE